MNTSNQPTRNPSLAAEEAALKRLHRNWEERSPGQRQADHHTLMWTLEALREAGFTIEYPSSEKAA